MAKNPVSVKNPFKEMYKGTTHNLKKDGMHRPEGAGNFDNMDDVPVFQDILTALTKDSVLFIDSKGKIVENNINFRWVDSVKTLTLGNVMQIAPASNTITTSNKELILEQTGETFGTTRLRIQSRNGATGALFENLGLDLMDFGFKGNSGYQSNIRYEHRSGQIQGGTDTSIGEFQILDDSTGSFNRFFNFNKNVILINGPKLLIGGTGVDPVSELDVDGGIALNVVTKTGTYTATTSDHTITCGAGNETFTITLPAVSGVTGLILNIKNVGTGTITIDGASSETIDGATTQVISTQYDSITIQCNGTEWWII